MFGCCCIGGIDACEGSTFAAWYTQQGYMPLAAGVCGNFRQALFSMRVTGAESALWSIQYTWPLFNLPSVEDFANYSVPISTLPESYDLNGGLTPAYVNGPTGSFLEWPPWLALDDFGRPFASHTLRATLALPFNDADGAALRAILRAAADWDNWPASTQNRVAMFNSNGDVIVFFAPFPNDSIQPRPGQLGPTFSAPGFTLPEIATGLCGVGQRLVAGRGLWHYTKATATNLYYTSFSSGRHSQVVPGLHVGEHISLWQETRAAGRRFQVRRWHEPWVRGICREVVDTTCPPPVLSPGEIIRTTDGVMAAGDLAENTYMTCST